MNSRPEPNVVFFSGGTALDGVSRVLKLETRRSVHVLTPFDSGGSTAALRRTFRMPAVGDVRSRLTALADDASFGIPELCALLSYRFTAEAGPTRVRGELQEMSRGDHPLVAKVPEALSARARELLDIFLDMVPAEFDFSLACVGNLMMTGAYLSEGRSFRRSIAVLSELLQPLGTVVLSADADRELGAILADGTLVIGQHRLTGRSEPPITSPVIELFLVDPTEPEMRSNVAADPLVAALVEGADLICYPVGSFYSSLIANLLPQGMGAAIVRARCPKVYVPNMGRDPEQNGMTVGKAVEQLVERVRRDAGSDVPVNSILNLVLLDDSDEAYGAPLDLARIDALGVDVARTALRAEGPDFRLDSKRASSSLLALTRLSASS